MDFDQEKTQAPPDVDYRLHEEMRAKMRAAECNLHPAGCDQASYARPMSNSEIVAEFFKYHAPNADTLPKYAAINQAAKNFAEIVLANCPSGADRAAAINLIRNARATANASVALNGLSLY
jgi:hypothetical protein